MTNAKDKGREIMRTIHAKLKVDGLSDEAIGNKAGMHTTSVHRMLSGKFQPRIDHVIKLAEVAGMEVKVEGK